MFGKINHEISNIVWRWKWQSKINSVNKEYKRKTKLVPENSHNFICVLFETSNNLNPFNRRNLSDYHPQILYPIATCSGTYHDGWLPRNYHYTSTTFIENLKRRRKWLSENPILLKRG